MDCCQEANNNRARSLALPALGTGFLKFPCDVVAQTTLKAVEDFSNQNPFLSLKRITIIVYYRDTAAFHVSNKRECNMAECKIYELNSLPKDKILDWSKLKAFADSKLNMAEKLKSVLRRV